MQCLTQKGMVKPVLVRLYYREDIGIKLVHYIKKSLMSGTVTRRHYVYQRDNG